jgi:hypothetical protein
MAKVSMANILNVAGTGAGIKLDADSVYPAGINYRVRIQCSTAAFDVGFNAALTNKLALPSGGLHDLGDVEVASLYINVGSGNTIRAIIE